jgi:hypothetical protein
MRSFNDIANREEHYYQWALASFFFLFFYFLSFIFYLSFCKFHNFLYQKEL